MQQREQRDRRLERQQQSLRAVAGALDAARATAHALSAQSEQLGRSERVVDETQHAVDLSKRVMRGMTWSGWVYNAFTAVPQLAGADDSGKDGREDKQAEIAMGFICPECKVRFASPEQLGAHYARVHDANAQDRGNRVESQRLRGAVQATTKTTRAAIQEDAQERFLRELEPQLAELKEVSLALGNALDTQNAQLDRLDTKVDLVNHNMKRVSIDAKKLAGQSFTIYFRFRCAFMETRSRRFLRDADGEALLDADIVGDGCVFRAFTLGEDTELWGFQSERSSLFMGINRFGNLKVRGSALNSYEQFSIDQKATTPLFCHASFFGMGGWVSLKPDGSVTIIRGSHENKQFAAEFKVVNVDDN